MKAKELIEILQADPEAEVLVTTDNFEMGHAKVRLEYVSKWRMQETTRPFRDAFDGGRYSAEVFEMNVDSGKEAFIL
jgi:hypothetical protein